MHALITRPLEDAKPLADLLEARGVECVVEPLLEIVPHDDAEIDLDGVQALLFTSANGVRAFAAHSSRRDIGVLTVGEGSADTARSAGFKNVMAAGGDVDTLAKLVIDRLNPSNGPLFHGAGSVLAGDLQGKLEQAGFTLRRTVLYEAKTATAFSPETRMNLALGGIDMVLLFSPRTARTFATLWTDAEKPSLAKTSALCLSAAVAREVAELGWQKTAIAPQPDQPAMLALVEAEIARRASASGETTKTGVKSATPPERIEPPVTRAPIIATQQPARRAGSAGGLIAGLIAGTVAGTVAGAAVVALGPYWQPLIMPPAVSGPVTSPQAAVDLAPIEARLSALESHPDKGVDPDQMNAAVTAAADRIDQKLSPLADRVGKLEQESGAPADLLPLLNRVAKLESQQSQLSSAASQPGGPDLSGDVAALKSANETLGQELKAAQAQIAALAANQGALESKQTTLGSTVAQIAAQPAAVTEQQQRATALVLALSELRGALSVGQPYAPRLQAIDSLIGDDADIRQKLDAALAPLRPLSDTGAPTLAQLQASLPATAIAEAANSEAAALAVGADQGWSERLINRLAQAVTIRPVGGEAEGDGPLARLARGEAKLKSGDLVGAVAELDGLRGKAATAATAWLDQAKARVAQDQAGTALDQAATALLAPKPEQ